MTSRTEPRRAAGAAGAAGLLAGFRLVLESIAGLSGLHVCLHDLTGFSRARGTDPLPPRLRVHATRFCTAVKRRPGGNERCLAECLGRANRTAGQRRRPFVKRCHAGVLEAAVPVLLGGRHVGTIFAGPAVERGRPAPPGGGRLPVRSRRELLEIGRLLSVVAAFAAEAGEALLIQELEGQARSEPVRIALRFAAERCCEPVTVADAARAAFLSPSRFAHVFSEETGVPFHRYLNALRIDRAKSLLAHSSLKVAEIAARCGFCNQNYFAGVFKAVAGQTPRAYRRSKQESVEI